MLKGLSLPVSKMLTTFASNRRWATGSGIGKYETEYGSGVVAPRVGSMPGRAVGEGVGGGPMSVAAASGVADDSGAADAPGVAAALAVAVPGVLTGAAALGFAARVGRAVCAAAVIAELENGKVQVGTAVRLGWATGGEA